MGDRREIVAKSLAATRRAARELGLTLVGGTALVLTGELGAGKTSFVQGLAEGLGVYDLSQVLSPTYTLVNEHPGARATLVHIDLYRLRDADEARALGIEEQLGRKDAVAAVEWGDRFPELLPRGVLTVRLTVEGRARRITIERE